MVYKDVDGNKDYRDGKIRVGKEKKKCKICYTPTLFRNSANGHYVCSSECLELDTRFDQE